LELELPRLLAPDLPSNCYLQNGFEFSSFQLPTLFTPALIFVVTASPYRHWAIFAPAAFLGSGSHFSGSLSGIEPWFPVTRCHHGRPRPYHHSW